MFRGTPEEIASLKVGDVLYNFDGNRRTYERLPGAKYSSGGPIYEKHFEAVTIESETKQSWVMGRYGAKVNKKTLDSRTEFADRGFFTKSAMEADIWLHQHRYNIVREVERVGLQQLQEIARIVGYTGDDGQTVRD